MPTSASRNCYDYLQYFWFSNLKIVLKLISLFYSIPSFCQGNKQSISHEHETLSDALQGVELEFSGYAMDFKG